MGARESILGWMPKPEDFDWSGLNHSFSRADFLQLQTIDTEEWRKELLFQDEFFIKLNSYTPKEFIYERELTVARL